MSKYTWIFGFLILSCADEPEPQSPTPDLRVTADKNIDYRNPDYRPVAPGTCWPTCSQAQFCYLAEGCKQLGPGICMDRPRSCSKIPSPVCGCNEQTYENECVAKTEGVNIQQVGECGVEGDAATRWDAGSE